MKLTINGKSHDVPAGKSLLRYLRDDLQLTSVKDGCSAGACGTCTVLINGAAVKSCIRMTEALEGADVLTVEGLSQRERDVYVESFAAAGAVQCGFCIPGMVIAAKALLDGNASPSRAEVKKAINGNICRCTGYQKIEDAILLASEYFRTGAEVPPAGEDRLCKNSHFSHSGLDSEYQTAGQEIAGQARNDGSRVITQPEGVLVAAAQMATVGADVKRPDAAAKVLGTGVFGDDIQLPKMIYAKALRAPAPRALINKIDISAALEHPDCVRVLTAADVPNNKSGHIKQDWDVMIAEGCETRYIGDAIALVGSRRAESLDEIIALIELSYEVLEPVTSATDALKAQAPLIHSGGNIMSKEYLRRGNVEEAIANASFCITRKYHTPHNDHAFMEPEVAVAVPVWDEAELLRGASPQAAGGGGGDAGATIAAVAAAAVAAPAAAAAAPAPAAPAAAPAPAAPAAAPAPAAATSSPTSASAGAPEPGSKPYGLQLYTGGQSVYDDRREVARMLDIPLEQVRVTTNLVGGGFGGKEDMSVQHHAALMAWHTGLPVKVKFSRQESINYHTKRHAMDLEFTTACDSEGHITAMKALLIADTGAYASLGGPVLQRACTHAAGPYHIPNIDILGMAVYTNNVVSGAYRGFGVTQSCFAMEGNLNELAELVGISPWEIRYRNAIRPGQALPNGQIASADTAMVETLEAVRDIYEQHPRAGIACGFKNSGKGIGLTDTGRCLLSVEGGKVRVRTSAACMGQGIAAVCMHMVSQATGIPAALIVHEDADTVRTPDSGTSTASRQTVLTGEACHRAAELLAEALTEAAGQALGQAAGQAASQAAGQAAEQAAGQAADKGASQAASQAAGVNANMLISALAALEGREFYAEFSPVTDPMGAPVPNPVSHVSYSYATQLVLLDEQGKVEKVVAAYDVGAPVNPRSCEGQIEGGVVMGLGFALTEDFPIEGGYPKVKYGTLGLMRATQAPPIDVLFTSIESERLLPYSYGAKGVGELCLIPTSPAAADAYYRLDGIRRRSLPLRGTYYKGA